MAWGVGRFGSLSQGANAQPFPALRIQNIHPAHLPYFLRYPGPFRAQAFFGQLDHDRRFSRPWLSGQLIAFKPLPTFEIGFTHAIMFGGRFNDRFGTLGFLGRASGFATGQPSAGNTKSRAGVFVKIYFPSLRNAVVYQEILGEDNLTFEARPIGRFLPFLAVSYQGGIYLPRLTKDGFTDLCFEYALLEPSYSIHNDSLYWTYNGALMGDPMGPNASELDLCLGRWFDLRYKLDIDAFYTEEAATYDTDARYPLAIYGSLHKERSAGAAFDLRRLPELSRWVPSSLVDGRARLALEYANHVNYGSGSSLRAVVAVTVDAIPTFPSFQWR